MRYSIFIKAIIATILVFTTVDVLAQKKYQKLLEVSYEAGPLISNGKDWANEIADLVSFKGADVRMGWRKVGDDFYNQLYRYPTFGLGFSTALAYYPEIGRPQGIYAFAELPITNKSLHKKLSFSYFSQIGLGFNLNPYDSLENPLNKYIGSSLNAYIHFGFKANYQVHDRIKVFGVLGLKHYSNGSAKRPNSGINLTPLSIGLQYNLNNEFIPKDHEMAYPPLEKRGFWNFALYLGHKNYEIGDPSYFRGGFGINYLWEASYKYRLGLGLDFFYAPGYESRFPDQKGTFSNQISTAIVGSWEFKLNERLYMPIGLGAYIHYNSENQESWFYERIGVRYRLKQNLFTGIQIKAHKAKADFFEFTMGYTIPGKIKSVINP